MSKCAALLVEQTITTIAFSVTQMTTEDDFSISQHISKMKTECEKKKPNISMLQDKMKRTDRERDVYIKERTTQEILIQKNFDWIWDHFRENTD